MARASHAQAPARGWRRRVALGARVLAAICGGWLFAAGFVMLCLALGRRAGLSYADAQTLAWLLVFIVFVAAICWTIAAASVVRAGLTLVAGGLLMTAVGGWLMGATA